MPSSGVVIDCNWPHLSKYVGEVVWKTWERPFVEPVFGCVWRNIHGRLCGRGPYILSTSYILPTLDLLKYLRVRNTLRILLLHLETTG